MKENALFLLGCSADEFGEEKAVALQINGQKLPSTCRRSLGQ